MLGRQTSHAAGLSLLFLLFSLLMSSSVQADGYVFVKTWGDSGTGDGQFVYPLDIALDQNGRIYVCDQFNNRIQKFDSAGTFLLKWGSSATLYGPSGIAVDSRGIVYVTDSGHEEIEKYNSSGVFIFKWGSEGTGDGQFVDPLGVAVDAGGNAVYVADHNNHRIQKFDSTGTFILKWGSEGQGDGQFEFPTDVAVDHSGNVYVTDSYNHRIQKFASNGTFITKWGANGTGNGEFNNPRGIAVDAGGNVYVGDTYNNRVQKFTASGVFLEMWGSLGAGNGQFNYPIDVAVEPSGKLYVSENRNHRIQKFTPAVPQVRVFRPNGGEVLTEGALEEIDWSATDDGTALLGAALGVTSISIYYSTNGGSTYPYTIATGLPNTGTYYPWSVPSTYSSNCKVKVVAYSGDLQTSDVSDGTFTIQAAHSGSLPSLSMWGTLALILGLGGVATVALRRRAA